jgi:hypothetical protein
MGGVACKSKTPSIARLDHSCVANAMLEVVNDCIDYDCWGEKGCFFVDGIFVVAEDHDFSNWGLLVLVGVYSNR